MENRINRPPSRNFNVDFLSGSSRKRKTTDVNQPGAISESNLQYTRCESNLQNTHFQSGVHVEDNTRGLCFNQAKSIEPTSLGHQFEKDQFPTQNVHPGSWLNCNGNLNLHGNRTENLINTSHAPPQPLEYKGSFDSLNMQASVVKPTWQTQVGPSKSYQFLPLLKSDGGNIRRDQVASSCEEIESKCGVSCELRQCSSFSNNGGPNNFPSVGAASLGSSQIQNPIFSQNGVQLGTSVPSGVTSRNISENGEQVQGNGFVKIKETEKVSDMKNLMHPLPESSPKISCPASTVESGQKTDQTRGSPISDEKSKSHFGKPASTVAEKLWDGSVQLSSSVVVSAVAFFKRFIQLLLFLFPPDTLLITFFFVYVDCYDMNAMVMKCQLSTTNVIVI